MKTRIFLTLALGLFLFSCDEVKEHTPSENPHSSSSQSDAHTDHQHEDAADDGQEAGLVLNDGKKWLVNDSMMIHVRKGESAVKAFASSKDKDYQLLVADLKGNIDFLISSCTMTGKSHDQLHVWLLPYIALVDDLEATTDTHEAADYFKEVEKSFETFNAYFE